MVSDDDRWSNIDSAPTLTWGIHSWRGKGCEARSYKSARIILEWRATANTLKHIMILHPGLLQNVCDDSWMSFAMP